MLVQKTLVPERLGDNPDLKVISSPGQIIHADRGTGKSLFQSGPDFIGAHHGMILAQFFPSAIAQGFAPADRSPAGISSSSRADPGATLRQWRDRHTTTRSRYCAR